MSSSAVTALSRVIGGSKGQTADLARREMTGLISSRDRAKRELDTLESAPAKALGDASIIGGVIIRAGYDRLAAHFGLTQYSDMAAPALALVGYGAGFATGSDLTRRSSLGFGVIDIHRAVAGEPVAQAHARLAIADELAELEKSSTYAKNAGYTPGK